MIRVGFILNGNSWMGGINYYRNLFSALHLLPDRKLQLVIFVGENVSEDIVHNFQHAEIVRTKLLSAGSPITYFRKLVNKISNRRDPLMSILLRRHKIDIVSHADSNSLLHSKSIKTIGWIPDFQHLHLRNFFSEKELFQRDMVFKKITRHCDRVLVSSETAQHDLAILAPEAIIKSRILRFVPEVDEDVPLASRSVLEHKYAFKGPYFFIPNQFWKHKNHDIVISALAELKLKGTDVTVLLSGDPKDYRHPGHYADLMEQVRCHKLENSFKVLGIIPYSDLLALMRYSLAVINPSFFEGWSSTVEEAKALGKRILLSNLPVHLEQNPSQGIFFDPTNSKELAEKMLLVLSDPATLECNFDIHIYSDSYKFNRQDFARKYQNIVLELV